MLVVFSDLDGTLLDTRYSFAPAVPAMRLLEERGVPLVFCSSKTRVEMEHLRQATGNAHPFISENGGGLYIPPGYFAEEALARAGAQRQYGWQSISLGVSYAELRVAMGRLREGGYAVRGFGDMSIEEVSELTGLSHNDAALAMQRDFDEPFVIEGGEEEGVFAQIESMGYGHTRGALHHIMGPEVDKGRAVRLMRGLFRDKWGQEITFAALGDNLNDEPMLGAVDMPIAITGEDGQCRVRGDIAGLRISQKSGPAGWAAEVMRLLEEFA